MNKNYKLAEDIINAGYLKADGWYYDVNVKMCGLAKWKLKTIVIKVWLIGRSAK